MAVSHNRTMSSRPPLASVSPFGLTATLKIGSPPGISMILVVVSLLMVAL
nr:hypothetical protein [Mycolicibacterium poriferae]